jgi:ribosome assembly protein YihI (activator of Der GTPase)
MGKSTKPKEKVVKEVELDAISESDRIDALQKDLDESISALYKDMIEMREKINKAMERLGLEAL